MEPFFGSVSVENGEVKINGKVVYKGKPGESVSASVSNGVVYVNGKPLQATEQDADVASSFNENSEVMEPFFGSVSVENGEVKINGKVVYKGKPGESVSA